jgi:hypothetical protein
MRTVGSINTTLENVTDSLVISQGLQQLHMGPISATVTLSLQFLHTAIFHL